MKPLKRILIILSAIIIASCAEPQAASESVTEPGAREIIEANGLRTGAIARQAMVQSFSVPARIEAPPQSTAQVYPTIGAFVREVYVIKGSKITRGDRLAALYHPDLLALQERYQAAAARLEQNRLAYERKQALLEEKATSLREVQQAKANYLSSKSEEQSLGSILRGMGIDLQKVADGELSETVFLLAPIGGHILGTRAGVGQYAGTDAPLFTIVNRDHLHLEMQVPPSHIDKVRPGNPVIFRTPGNEVSRKGEVYLVNAVADESGFFNVHAHFEDEENILHPGTYAEAQIVYLSDTVPALPLTAVWEEEGISYVLALEDDHFHEIPVSTGWSNDEYVSILNARELDGLELVMNGVRYLRAKDSESGHSH